MSPPTAKKTKLEAQKPNFELANMLAELADYEKNVNRQIYKYNAYRKAVRSIIDYPVKITSTEDVKNLEGVGSRISKKIGEYLETGKITKLEKLRESDEGKAIKELIRVAGIGPAAAQKFVLEGIRTLDGLKANLDKLNHHQKIGLKHVEDFEKRIPRNEMIEMQDLLFREIELLDKEYISIICGSFRRGASSSGDIDLLITHPSYVSTSYAKESVRKKTNDLIVDTKRSPKPLLDKIVNRLIKINFVTDTIAFGDTKFAGVCRLNDKLPFRRIDIRLIPHDQYFCGILYFTGSDMFNKNMRRIALEKGYTLNEYSLRKIGSTGIPGKPLKVTSEEDIFHYLEMDFKKPEERTL